MVWCDRAFFNLCCFSDTDRIINVGYKQYQIVSSLSNMSDKRVLVSHGPFLSGSVLTYVSVTVGAVMSVEYQCVGIQKITNNIISIYYRSKKVGHFLGIFALQSSHFYNSDQHYGVFVVHR